MLEGLCVAYLVTLTVTTGRITTILSVCLLKIQHKSCFYTCIRMNKQPPQNAGHCDASFSMETRLLSARTQPMDPHQPQPLTVPIYHSSTYRFHDTQQYVNVSLGKEIGHIYQRLDNPTNETAELMLMELESSGVGSLLYGSGLQAAIDVMLCFLSSGDHMLCQLPVYSGVHNFIMTVLRKFGVDVSYVASGSPGEEWEKQIRPNTKMLWGETPCNPNNAILDFDGFATIKGCYRDLITVIDGTFASPFNQQPLLHGVDISLHSCSKYLGGHSDLIGGCVTVADLGHWQRLKKHQSCSGSTMSALVASLLIRGMKTLPLRMERHNTNALKVATFLDEHPKVSCVYYAGLSSHKNHAVAKRQMTNGFGGMISFDMGTYEAAKCLVEKVRLINLAVSLGGSETLIQHPDSMTHGPMLMSEEARNDANIPAGLIRLSVGLESPEDLIKDLQRALDG